MPDLQNDPLSRIERQLERLDDLTRNLATRSDLDALRKEVVARDLLEPQLSLLRTQITQIDASRIADKLAFEKRLEEMEKEQVSRADKLWARLSPAIAGIALLITIFEFLSHFRFTP